MKKINILLSTFAIFGFLIAACSSPQGTVSLETQQPTAAVTQAQGSLPNTGGVTETATPSGSVQQPAQTPYPPLQTTEESPTTQAYPTAQATQVITPTQTEVSGSVVNSQFDPGHLSNLMQLQVMDQNNQTVGVVKDMVLDLQNLQVEYVVVDLNQSTSSSQQAAVPWSMFTLETNGSSGQTANSQNAFIFNGDLQKLAGAPQFNPDMLPPLGQPVGNWDASIRSYWGSGQAGTSNNSGSVETPTTPSVTKAPPQVQTENTGLQGVILASQALAYNIDGPNNQQSASVKDVILDPTSGELQYVLVSINGIQGLTKNMLIPVPLGVLSWNAQNNTIDINVPPQVLLNAPKFAPGQLPRTTNPNWDADIRSFWQQYLQPQSP
jgi:sporulation protein YlmC with PRC-barrel domain